MRTESDFEELRQDCFARAGISTTICPKCRHTTEVGPILKVQPGVDHEFICGHCGADLAISFNVRLAAPVKPTRVQRVFAMPPAPEQRDLVVGVDLSKNWERAAIVWAYTTLNDYSKVDRRTLPVRERRRYSPASFAKLGITGLTTTAAVQRYRSAWRLAMKHGAPDIRPGDPMPTVDIPFPVGVEISQCFDCGHPISFHGNGTSKCRAMGCDCSSWEIETSRPSRPHSFGLEIA